VTRLSLLVPPSILLLLICCGVVGAQTTAPPPPTGQATTPATVTANARADLQAQADPEADTSGLAARYPKSQARNFDGRPGLTEMDALVAYLQMLGTLAEFDWRHPNPEMVR